MTILCSTVSCTAGISFAFIHPASAHAAATAQAALQATLLRNAITVKSVDAYRQVYCWKAIHCLELWARVLAAHSPACPDLQPLVYPVTQILLGAARLVPSARWFPVRLRLCRVLIALAGSTGAFMPVVPPLLEVLAWPDFAKPARGAGAAPNLLLQLRLSKASLKQPATQQALIEQVRWPRTSFACPWRWCPCQASRFMGVPALRYVHCALCDRA